jgi:hypothetical protein
MCHVVSTTKTCCDSSCMAGTHSAVQSLHSTLRVLTVTDRWQLQLLACCSPDSCSYCSAKEETLKRFPADTPAPPPMCCQNSASCA